MKKSAKKKTPKEKAPQFQYFVHQEQYFIKHSGWMLGVYQKWNEFSVAMTNRQDIIQDLLSKAKEISKNEFFAITTKYQYTDEIGDALSNFIKHTLSGETAHKIHSRLNK